MKLAFSGETLHFKGLATMIRQSHSGRAQINARQPSKHTQKRKSALTPKGKRAPKPETWLKLQRE
ncbi:hypothetical protein [Leucobacter sp. 1207-22]|uniref:hypothetical protein n=1 Tax=Leucobacter sp. 1207-22 TaxID=2604456 RepID=UPI004063EDC1